MPGDVNVSGGRYKIEQSGFTWILVIALLAVGGIILWILISARDAVKETAGDIQSGAIGKTLANNVTGLAGGLLSGIGNGIKNTWKGIKGLFSSTPDKTPATPANSPTVPIADSNSGIDAYWEDQANGPLGG